MTVLCVFLIPGSFVCVCVCFPAHASGDWVMPYKTTNNLFSQT